MPATGSIRAVLEIGGKLQRRMQDSDVERGDGDRGDDHLAVLDATVSLHAPGGPLRHHHRRHARPHRLRGGNSSVACRQGRLLRVPRRLPRRRLRQRRDRTSNCSMFSIRHPPHPHHIYKPCYSR